MPAHWADEMLFVDSLSAWLEKLLELFHQSPKPSRDLRFVPQATLALRKISKGAQRIRWIFRTNYFYYRVP